MLVIPTFEVRFAAPRRFPSLCSWRLERCRRNARVLLLRSKLSILGTFLPKQKLVFTKVCTRNRSFKIASAHIPVVTENYYRAGILPGINIKTFNRNIFELLPIFARNSCGINIKFFIFSFSKVPQKLFYTRKLIKIKIIFSKENFQTMFKKIF